MLQKESRTVDFPSLTELESERTGKLLAPGSCPILETKGGGGKTALEGTGGDPSDYPQKYYGFCRQALAYSAVAGEISREKGLPILM